jgi:hypothetical protein
MHVGTITHCRLYLGRAQDGPPTRVVNGEYMGSIPISTWCYIAAALGRFDSSTIHQIQVAFSDSYKYNKITDYASVV